jgi:hypothetical protein
MKKTIMTIAMLALVAPALSTLAHAKNAKVAAAQAPDARIVSGVVETMESMENESLVKIKGSESMYSIKNLFSFPENKLNALSGSKDSGSAVKIKVNVKNEIVDVLL